MKNLSLNLLKIIVLVLISFVISCKKDRPNFNNKNLADDKKDETLAAAPQTIFTAEQHTFSDIQICYDDKIFLLEGGKLKRLIGSELVDVDLPASVYAGFSPTFLAISKDYTFYLRASNGIKVIKGGKEIKFYKVGVAPLQDFTESTFGYYEISVDETDQSLVFGLTFLGLEENAFYFVLGKLTKSGAFARVSFDGDVAGHGPQEFITSFGIGGTPGVFWDAGLGYNGIYYNGQLVKSSLNNPPFDYHSSNTYGREPSTHISFPIEGPIEQVQFGVINGIEVSKDGKTTYLKTGDYEDEDSDYNNGSILKIFNNQVTLIGRNIKNKRLAISNDGKTLYIAGNGLTKIDL